MIIANLRYKNIINMKRIVFGVIAIMILAIGVSCDRKEVLDSEKDYVLMRAFESAQHQSEDGIDVEALENSATLYEKRGEKGKVCLCDALIGSKLFYAGKYDKSLIHLKKAEANIQYCDSIASFVYSMIVSNTMTTDTTLALNYAHKALEKDLEYNNLRRLPYIYMNLSLLTKGDSARYYLEKSLEYFDDWGDMIARCKYAWWHIDELHPDTLIAYAKSCYDSVGYAGNARVLAEAYLRKGDFDSAQIYIEAIGKHKFFQTDYFFYNSRRLDLLGEYKAASENWAEAYTLLKKDALFMFSQRLSAINGEYDLLCSELENEKEKLMMMKVYVMTLLILVIGLLIAIVVIFRYKRNIGVLEVDIEKRKERFNTLFERYKDGYVADRNTIFDDVKENLQVLNEDYPKLTNTDLAIVWLVFMNCSRDRICEMMNISSRYYYNRRSIIQKELGIQLDDSEESRKRLERLIKKYISEKIKR